LHSTVDTDCRKAPAAMSKACCAPFVHALQTERLDFQLEDTDWKEVFGKQGGLLAGCTACSPAVYVATRMTISIVWWLVCIWSIIDWLAHGFGFGYWLTKLTHWGALIEAIYFTFAALTTYRAVYGSQADGPDNATPWHAQVTWLLGPIALVASFMICILYWFLVFEPGPGKPAAISVFTHAVNFVLILADLLLNRQPFYIQHVFAPMLFASLYGVFTLVYFWVGGTHEDGTSPYIYKAIDWRKSAKTGTLVGIIVLILVPLVYTLLFFVVSLRVRCRKATETDVEKFTG